MPTQELTLFQAMSAKTKWLNKRQQVLAQNIANADTPGYRPQDLKALDFKDVLAKSSSQRAMSANRPNVTKTNSAHIGSGVLSGREVSPKDQRKTYEVAPAGNSVVIEEQLLKANQTAGDHRLMLNLYQKNIAMLRAAIGQN